MPWTSPPTAVDPIAAAVPVPDRMPARQRLIWGAVSAGAAAVLGLAAWLEPSPTGLGTHSSLGLPPCGWIAAVDVPCPTCGMTTAFAHAADGDLVAALAAQPMGCVLAIAAAITLVAGVYAAASGARVGSLLTRLWSRRTAWAAGIAFVGAWVYKILVYKELLG